MPQNEVGTGGGADSGTGGAGPLINVTTGTTGDGKNVITELVTGKTIIDDVLGQIKAVVDAFKVVMSDKDLWDFVGNYFVNFVGEAQITVEQAKKLDQIKAILAKPDPMSYADAGALKGLIDSLLLPGIMSVFQKQAPWLLDIIGVLTKISGV
jgi:hypothetical protein